MTNFSLLFKYNLLITAFIFLTFLVFNDNYSFLSFIVTFIASISSAIIVYLVLYLVFLLFSGLGKLGLYISAFGFTFINFAFIINFVSYYKNNTHLELLDFDLIYTANIIDGLKLDIVTLFVVSLIIVILIFIELYLINGICRLDRFQKKRENDGFNKILIIPCLLFILSDKISYGILSLNEDDKMTTYYKVIPLYQTVDFSKFINKYSDLKKEFNL